MHFSPEERRLIYKLAQQHAVSESAVEALFVALEVGRGSMAQFNHPELGGMGQWLASGMIMVGDFSNHRLKATVAQLCNEIAEYRQSSPSVRQQPFPAAGWSVTANWWLPEFGTPTASGSQNAMHYAYFAQPKRLIIRLDSQVSIYDTQEHRISSVSQQQDQQQKLVFHSQKGEILLEKLPKLQEYKV